MRSWLHLVSKRSLAFSEGLQGLGGPTAGTHLGCNVICNIIELNLQRYDLLQDCTLAAPGGGTADAVCRGILALQAAGRICRVVASRWCMLSMTMHAGLPVHQAVAVEARQNPACFDSRRAQTAADLLRSCMHPASGVVQPSPRRCISRAAVMTPVALWQPVQSFQNVSTAGEGRGPQDPHLA